MKKNFCSFTNYPSSNVGAGADGEPSQVLYFAQDNGTAIAEIVFNGKIQSGWHVYSTGLGADGPISATFNVNKMDGVELVGKLQARGNEISKFDPLFEMKLRYFEGSVYLRSESEVCQAKLPYRCIR